ncbi:proteasome activator complex subunit 3-like [Drosophila miranda]|uniref:proteasome activator complex subunit 3-like n=1 Tax=Drosophila miranda TaxID=7229 RepID=UPI0007E726EE|nr:proteasome activator complex subunit 3-like [Drosophila miranda]
MSSMSVNAIPYPKALVTKLGTQLIAKDLPEKIVELNELLDSSMFKEVQQEQGTPVLPSAGKVEGQGDGCTHDQHLRKLARPVPCEKAVCEMMEVVKPILRTLIANANLFNLWVSSMIPERVSGDSLGVSIQKHVQEEIVKVQSEADAYFEKFLKYFDTRAKAARIASEYPHVEECGKLVVEIDQINILYLQNIVREVRNFYSLLHDLGTKNWDKLQNGQSSNTNGYH